jgi:hypothetical protein
MFFKDWDEVETVARQVMLASGETFDTGTICNAEDLLGLCRSQCPVPECVAKGYWTTLSVYWPGLEFEVFEDRIEVYRFKGNSSTDIWYEEHSSGQEFSARFLDELPRAKGLQST